jgi:hypothetical protein
MLKTVTFQQSLALVAQAATANTMAEASVHI